MDHSDSLPLTYRLLDNPVVPKWIERVETAQRSYHIDAPDRFYGFGPLDQQVNTALTKINQCIDTINSHKPIISRRLEQVDDQDTLNYLHHIFEVYHGLLDCQNTEYWNSAPPLVRLALADLNILVHRCESVYRGAVPRHVVTWYGLPKTKTLDVNDYQYFTRRYESGTVYLNYVEIGKTFEDLATDNDRYIAPDAFRPFQHYSADFNVRFADVSDAQLDTHHNKLVKYYREQEEFFNQRGLNFGHCLMQPGQVPLAQLVTNIDVIKELTNRQYVLSVNFQ